MAAAAFGKPTSNICAPEDKLKKSLRERTWLEREQGSRFAPGVAAVNVMYLLS
jgi:hypothetical protein